MSAFSNILSQNILKKFVTLISSYKKAKIHYFI